MGSKKGTINSHLYPKYISNEVICEELSTKVVEESRWEKSSGGMTSNTEIVKSIKSHKMYESNAIKMINILILKNKKHPESKKMKKKLWQITEGYNLNIWETLTNK